MLTPSLQILESAIYVVNRFIPSNCQIKVNNSQFVLTNQLLASYESPGKLKTIRIMHDLNSLLIKENDQIFVDDIIFRKKYFFNFFENIVKSNYAGTIEKIDTENKIISIRQASSRNEIVSFATGNVTNISKSNIEITGRGSLIQGVIGFGSENFGILSEYNEKEIQNKIVFFKETPDISILKKIIKETPRGLIIPSIDHKLLDYLNLTKVNLSITGKEELDFTIIITEGFGNIPMLDKTYAILSKYNGLLTSINGKTQIRAGAVRPEIIIPHDQNLVSNNLNKIEVGALVRLTRYPYFGKIGRIIDLPVNPVTLDSGIRTRIALVDIGQVIKIPRNNLELI